MKRLMAITSAGVLTLALSALALQGIEQASAGSAPAADGEASCCSEGGCFDSATCGDEATLCPAGPDCFAPDVCPDEDMVCPADEPAAAQVADQACTSACCSTKATDA